MLRLHGARLEGDAPAPLTQADVAARVGVSQRLASYHLTRLVASGLVERAAGRPAGYAASGGLREGLPPQP